MKKFIYPITMVAIMLFACQSATVRYTQDSPEINTVKNLISNYNNRIFDTSMYADTTKMYYNTMKDPMTVMEAMGFYQQADTNFTEREIMDDHQEYVMVVTDKNETWVNSWMVWKGTLKANNQVVEIPLHLTFQFEDGKIVKEYGYWDSSEVVIALVSLEAHAKITKELASGD